MNLTFSPINWTIALVCGQGENMELILFLGGNPVQIIEFNDNEVGDLLGILEASELNTGHPSFKEMYKEAIQVIQNHAQNVNFTPKS